MLAWRRVSLVGPTGTLRAPGEVAAEIGAAPAGGVVLEGHLFGQVAPYARHLCASLAPLGRPWAVQGEAGLGHDRALLRAARQSGCRTVLVGPEPDPLGRDADGEHHPRTASDLRRIRRAGLLTVVHCVLGRPGDDAGVFARAVRLCVAGRAAFVHLTAAEGARAMSDAELESGLAWARRAVMGHAAVWRRTGLGDVASRAALVANYRVRRAVVAVPRVPLTPAMRLARALARPIPVRERVPFVPTLVGAMQAGSDQVRSAWLRARAMRDDTLAALVIRLEGAIDARAARTLTSRVRRAIAGTSERIVIDLGGLELVSLTVLTRFLEEHAPRLAELRGRLAFRNLRPAIAAVRRNLHGMLPNATLLETALEDAP
jgi:anti-anti-sigma regulatory factor